MITSPNEERVVSELKRSYRHQTKRDFVYGELRAQIMRCELNPGERIIIDDVARRLGVSQIPVREAIQQLQSEQLVDNIPHIGATVAPISPTDVSQVFALMEGLETVAVEAVVNLESTSFLTQLEGLVAQMEEAVALGDRERWATLNGDFHRRIAAETQMPLLVDMMNRTLDHWDRIRRYFNILSRRLDRAQAQHREILEAFRSHDVGRLQDLMRQHNREPKSAYSEQLKELVAKPGIPEQLTSTMQT